MVKGFLHHKIIIGILRIKESINLESHYQMLSNYAGHKTNANYEILKAVERKNGYVN